MSILSSTNSGKFNVSLTEQFLLDNHYCKEQVSIIDGIIITTVKNKFLL